MRTKRELLAYTLTFSLLLGITTSPEVSAAKKVSLSNKKLTITKGKSKTLKVKNTKKKVKWKILSGKTNITMKKKGKAAVTIKGQKKGSAKVQATIEKKKLTCKVTVKAAATPKKAGSVTTSSSATPADTKPSVTSVPPTNTQVPPSVSSAPASAEPVITSNPPANSQTPPSASVTPDSTALPAVSSNPPANSQTPPSISASPDQFNEQDVKALEKLIRTQRERGATVDEDLHSTQYVWDNGRLTEIRWGMENLSGELDVSDLVNLTELSCFYNDITSLVV